MFNFMYFPEFRSNPETLEYYSLPGRLQRAIKGEQCDLVQIFLSLRHSGPSAYGDYDFHAMVEANTQRFASVRPAHGPAKSSQSPNRDK